MDNQQYFTDSPAASDDELRSRDVTVRGHAVTVQLSDRVFSGTRVDLGTAQLLDQAPPLPESGRFLDIGCGWGPIALAMALDVPAAKVWAIDVNERALDLTRRNAAANGAPNVYVVNADDALAEARERQVTFDRIWSNPPIRIGKQQLHDLLTTWLAFLTPETGRAYLTVQKNLGADSLIKWLTDQGFASRKISSKKGFRIIEVDPRS